MKKQPTMHFSCCDLDRSAPKRCSNITTIKETFHVPVLPLTEDGFPSVLSFTGMMVTSYPVPGFRPTKSKRKHYKQLGKKVIFLKENYFV